MAVTVAVTALVGGGSGEGDMIVGFVEIGRVAVT